MEMAQFTDKTVKNQLFNAAVTGGTLEDYSQNVVLLTPPEPDPPQGLTPIPLFEVAEVPPPAGTTPQPLTLNAYRRNAGSHKLSYAQIPGLVSTAKPSMSAPQPLPSSSNFYSFTPEEPSSSILNPVKCMGPEALLLNRSVEAVLPKCRPAYHHWFYKKVVESRASWVPFSMVDSLALESAFVSPSLNPDTLVATDGGRFDVNLLRRERFPIYWKSPPTEVRRCSWFYKSHNDSTPTPFEESTATLLEDEYRNAFERNAWNHKVQLSNGESIVMIGPEVLFLFPTSQVPDPWDYEKSQVRAVVVKRGLDDFHIEEGESERIDHLLLLVHGIGSVCDLKFRTVEQVVDEFRSIAAQLLSTHYQISFGKGVVHRIEVLPVSWHDKLHSDDTGIDTKLKEITLSSIPRLRDFTNDTLLDILLYTSPLYCQTIVNSVGSELNRIFQLFKSRTPSYEGAVSLGGHSLGSLILFDILCHQKPDDISTSTPAQPSVVFPQLDFQPSALFALGSPIGMFLTTRGSEKLGDDFVFPTCKGFFNIYHPYDPVAYRIEPLVNRQFVSVKPVLIPHHKGRKRMHLELKDTVSRVGADLKHKLMDSVKTTWNTLFQMGLFTQESGGTQVAESGTTEVEEFESNVDVRLGKFNNGRRIDYVLQEAPFEIFNEYLFALTSHMCYWESEDTILLILNEIYNSMGVSSDSLMYARQNVEVPESGATKVEPPPTTGFYKLS